MAILPLHNSKILRKKTFGRKFSSFERVRQTIGNQPLVLILAKKGLRWLSKVNAEKKFGVAVFFYGMLTETQKGIKNVQKTCTKP